MATIIQKEIKDYNYQSIYNQTFEFVKDFMSKYDPSHDLLHIQRVVNLALKLSKTQKDIDIELVELGALLHDVTDSKYVNSNEAINIAELLQKFGLPIMKSEKVGLLVNNVGYRKELKYKQSGIKDPLIEEFKELHIVQDADKLDAIGAIGILRCACFSGAKNIPLLNYETDNIYFGSEDQLDDNLKVSGTAISHFYDKLLRIQKGLKTELGKELGLKRHTFMKAFLNELNLEQQP